ncbi:hypothetical protein N8824_04595 [Candidatus Pelagibacter sp.]|nr:hypothetical protein [Candidatus Pelagibacter sp.]
MKNINILVVEGNIPEDTEVFQDHIRYISEEDEKLDFDNRTCEVRN